MLYVTEGLGLPTFLFVSGFVKFDMFVVRSPISPLSVQPVNLLFRYKS